MFFALIFLLAWCFIYPLTDYYTRLFNPAVMRRISQAGKKIHLSFDDGPDPRYTQEVLDILKKNGVLSTFFLIGEKASQNPEIVLRIIADGHEIGVHSQEHRHSYCMFYSKSIQAVKKGYNILTDITSHPIKWFRPPWGSLNFFESIIVRKLNLKIVLWSVNAQDWLIKTKPVEIMKRIQTRTKPGAIIVLHDSGGEPGAPRQMLQILPDLISLLKKQGYQFVTLTELTDKK